MRKFLISAGAVLILFTGLIMPLKVNAEVSINQKAAETSEAENPSESEEAASLTWRNQETGYQVIVEDDAGLLSEEDKSLLTEMPLLNPFPTMLTLLPTLQAITTMKYFIRKAVLFS